MSDSVHRLGQAGTLDVRAKRINLLAHYLRCFYDKEPSGDVKFDSALMEEEMAAIILDRLEDA